MSIFKNNKNDCIKYFKETSDYFKQKLKLLIVIRLLELCHNQTNKHYKYFTAIGQHSCHSDYTDLILYKNVYLSHNAITLMCCNSCDLPQGGDLTSKKCD